MAARSWTQSRTIEVITLAAVALFSIVKHPYIPSGIIFCAAVFTAILKAPTQISDSRIRRCEDGVGLACGAFLPIALVPSLPQSCRFPALSASATVVTTAYLKRRRAPFALCIYAFLCATQSTGDPRTVPHVLLGAAVPFITDAQLRAYPRTFTLAESAIIAAGIVGILTVGGDGQWKPEASTDAVTNAALIGAILLWVGLADFMRTPKASVSRRSAVVFGTIAATYTYAWRLISTEPVLWVIHHITADAKRWGVFLGWVAVLGCAIIVLRPEQKFERVVARKYYHMVGMIVFYAGIACDEGLTRLGSAVGLCMMLLAEMGRVAGMPGLRKVVNEFAGRLVDERDAGAVVVTHIYLLLGCAGPLWIGGVDAFKRGGVVAVCCMDAIAAAIGRRWGKTRWPGSSRTVEGSVAGFLGAVIFARAWKGGNEVIIAAFVGSVVEAVTGQIDNLVLPMTYCSVVGILS